MAIDIQLHANVPIFKSNQRGFGAHLVKLGANFFQLAFNAGLKIFRVQSIKNKQTPYQRILTQFDR